MHCRRPALTSLCVVAMAATAAGQTPPGLPPPCGPRIEVGVETPPRIAARLRALSGTLPPVGGDACHAPQVRVTWTSQRLTLDVALEDGRMATRSLRSVEDVLPTLLAVLSDPPDVRDAAPAAPGPALPAETPAAGDAPPALQGADAEDPVEPVTVPVTVALPASVARQPAWGLVLAMRAGVTTPTAGVGALPGAAIAVGLSRGRLRVSLEGSYHLRESDGHHDGDPGASVGVSPGVNTGAGQRGAEAHQGALVVAAQHRAPLGRFALDAGGYAGGVWTDTRAAGSATHTQALAMRLGLDAAFVVPLPHGFDLFARGDLYLDVRPQDGTDMADTAVFAGSLSVGAAWGSAR